LDEKKFYNTDFSFQRHLSRSLIDPAPVQEQQSRINFQIGYPGQNHYNPPGLEESQPATNSRQFGFKLITYFSLPLMKQKS